MAGPLLILGASVAAACGVPEDRVEDALQALVRMDVEPARTALADAEAAFACAPVAPADLSRYWLLEAALAAFAGDDEDAADAFRAAALADPTIWIVDLGPDLLRKKEAAAAAVVETGLIELKDVDPDYLAWVDGRPATLPLEVPAGLHLVQLADEGDVRYGLVVYVLAGRASAVEPGLPPLERPVAVAAVVPAPAPVPVPAPAADTSSVRLHAGLGGAVAFGESLERFTAAGETATEPATKVLLPLELGASWERAPAFVRATVAVAPLLGGELLFLGDDGIRSTPLALAPALAGGALFGPVVVGGALGMTLPSRVTPAALVGVRAPGLPVLIELRLGANLLPDRGPEPALALVVAFVPELT